MQQRNQAKDDGLERDLMTLLDLYHLVLKRKIVFLLLLIIAWVGLSSIFLTKPARYHYQMAFHVSGYLHKHATPGVPLSFIYSSGQVGSQILIMKQRLIKKYKADNNLALLKIARSLSAATTVWQNRYDVLVFAYGGKDQSQQVKTVFNQLMKLYSQSSYQKLSTKKAIVALRLENQFLYAGYQFATKAERIAARDAYVQYRLDSIDFVPTQILIPFVKNPDEPGSIFGWLLLSLILAFVFSTVVTTIDKYFLAAKDNLCHEAN